MTSCSGLQVSDNATESVAIPESVSALKTTTWRRSLAPIGEPYCPRCGRLAAECRNITPARFRYDVTYNGPIAWQYICECGHRWEGESG
jgi:hypothetical protein